MLLNHAADSDEGKEQWRVIDLKSLDAEMEVDWLQRAEEQTAEQDSGVPLMGRAWFLKRAPWLHAAWADCGEVAFWRLDINGAERVWGLGLSLVTRELNLKPDPGKAEPQTVHGRLLGFPSPISRVQATELTQSCTEVRPCKHHCAALLSCNILNLEAKFLVAVNDLF